MILQKKKIMTIQKQILRLVNLFHLRQLKIIQQFLFIYNFKKFSRHLSITLILITLFLNLWDIFIGMWLQSTKWQGSKLRTKLIIISLKILYQFELCHLKLSLKLTNLSQKNKFRNFNTFSYFNTAEAAYCDHFGLDPKW